MHPTGTVLDIHKCINDLPENVKSYMNMFADDAKIMKHIVNEDSCRELQEDLEKIHQWSRRWKMELNLKKVSCSRKGSKQV